MHGSRLNGRSATRSQRLHIHAEFNCLTTVRPFGTGIGSVNINKQGVLGIKVRLLMTSALLVSTLKRTEDALPVYRYGLALLSRRNSASAHFEGALTDG